MVQSSSFRVQLTAVLIVSNVVIQSEAFLNFSQLIYTATELDSKISEIPYTFKIPSKEYDFIVVGSGAAGSVIANRLSENPDWKILLLEAGSPPDALTSVPYYSVLYQLSSYNWGYTMEREDGVCEAMINNRCAWPRGKALGGTSATQSYMIYSRGNPIDYDKWAAEGNSGWSYNEVLPYFLKSENCRLGSICNNSYHNTSGPISIEYGYESELSRVFLSAGQELGINQVDYNSRDFLGFSRIQSTHKNGRRDSVKTAFLDPIRSRENLDILCSVRVTKVLIDPTSKSAQGVEFHYENKIWTVNASKEVVLSAGSFNSPQLLMLSGVGPKEHLTELGIPVIKDLPIGETLYDQITHITQLFIINKTEEKLDQQFNPLRWIDWSINGKGLLTSNSGIDNIGFIRTNVSNDVEGYPDLEILLNSFGGLNYDYGLVSRPELRVRQEIYDEYITPLQGLSTYALLPVLIHPKSVGSLKLKSANPFDPPLLHGEYYTDSDDQDLKTMIAGIRFGQKLSKSAAFRRLGAKEYNKPFPGCENIVYDTDEYYKCVLQSSTVSIHHQVGACKMGPNDTVGVVDNDLRVYGINKLRVADTSVVPLPLSGHAEAPSMMIGEKMGDILKEAWEK